MNALEISFVLKWVPEHEHWFCALVSRQWNDLVPRPIRTGITQPGKSRARMKLALDSDYPLARACEAAAANGHLAMLRWLTSSNSSWDDWVMMRAARGGHINCLEYCNSIQKRPTHWVYAEAALGGHLDCLKYLCETWWPLARSHWTADSAAQSGSLACLEYAMQYGFPFNVHTAIIAAEHGHLDCLRLILGCADYTDERIEMAAAQNNHEHVVKFMRQKRISCLMTRGLFGK